jgi:hypothetical protein
LERFCASDAEAFVAADRLTSPLGAVGVRIYAGFSRRALVADGFSYYILAARAAGIVGSARRRGSDQPARRRSARPARLMLPAVPDPTVMTIAPSEGAIVITVARADDALTVEHVGLLRDAGLHELQQRDHAEAGQSPGARRRVSVTDGRSTPICSRQTAGDAGCVYQR